MSRKPADFLWALLASLGIWFVMPKTGTHEDLDMVGVFFALFAGAPWAFYIYFGQKAGKDLHGGAAVAVGTAIATFVAAPVALMRDGERIFSSEHYTSVLPAGIAMAILVSALPYSFGSAITAAKSSS